MLRVDFLTRGMQMVSCASDGLVKIWNVKDEECATTLDGHEEKVRLAFMFVRSATDEVDTIDLGASDRKGGEDDRFRWCRLGHHVLGGCDGD